MAVAAVIVVVAAGIAAKSAVASNQPPALPRVGAVQRVNDADVGDPFILPVATAARSGKPASTTYYLYWTTDWQSNVPMASSTDLVHWQSRPDAFPVLPLWAEASNKMTWSPALVAIKGRYLMYVSTEEASSGRQCIALATAPRPDGPYADRTNHPFICQQNLGGSIDPAIVRDAAGHLHLLWKNDGNCCGQPTAIWEQKLSADGMHVLGTARRLLSADLAWQGGNIEAPAMIAAAGHGWWLFYSGNAWRSGDYATGLAFCTTVEGPCRETSQRPFLASTAELRTPGGLETFQDSRHRTWIAFTTTVLVPSRRNPARHYLNRVLDIAPLVPA
ncbi:MAG: glycoside hydrolase family 43 protein [Actinomycetota bacterium]|nr:glycoside hydrolase family 43 protein [Actinomycetota bacterium]